MEVKDFDEEVNEYLGCVIDVCSIDCLCFEYVNVFFFKFLKFDLEEKVKCFLIFLDEYKFFFFNLLLIVRLCFVIFLIV